MYKIFYIDGKKHDYIFTSVEKTWLHLRVYGDRADEPLTVHHVMLVCFFLSQSFVRTKFILKHNHKILNMIF